MTTYRSWCLLAALLLAPAAAFAASAPPPWVSAKGGCAAVPLAKCGTDFSNNCLYCGDKSDYDCEKCCPGCYIVTKGGYSYCVCKGPKPPPGPPGPPPTPSGGNDTWATYTVAGMDVISVTGGKVAENYQKVVVMLHGGGVTGAMWEYQYNAGWFGNLDGIKYVFPTSALPGHVWYQSYKNGCGLNDDCAYNISSIEAQASRVASLIEHEQTTGAIANKDTYLAGFSEGGQVASYMQLAKLDFALGGVIVMDGFPLPPLCDMPPGPAAAAKANATYTGLDMKWMIYWGEDDPIFPVKLSMDTYHGIFDVLGINSTLVIDHTEPGMTHTVIQKEFEQMVSFIKGSGQ